MLRLVGALFFPLVLAHGQSDLFRFLPADPAVVLSTFGPSAWREQLGGTNLGKALAAPGLKKPMQELLAYAWKESGIDDGLRAHGDKIQEWLLGYGGKIVVGLTIDWSPLANDRSPRLAMSVAVHPDGTADVTELATEITALLPGRGAADVRIGDHAVKLRVVGKYGITEPIVQEGSLVFWWGHALAAQTERLKPAERPFEPAAELTRGVAFVQMDLASTWSALRDVFGRATEGSPVPALKLFDLAAVAACTRFTYSMFADGPHLGQELIADFAEGPRGIYDVIAPPTNRQPRALRYLPANQASFSVLPYDAAALHTLYQQVFALLGDSAPMTREQVEEAFTKATKLRLNEDLLALLDGEWLQIDCFVTNPEELDEESDAENAVFVLPLRDAAQAMKNIDTALRARGLHAGRKSEDYNGSKVWRLSVPGAGPIEYSFLRDAVVVGIGKEPAERVLRLVLDAAATHERGEAAAPLHPTIVGKMKDLPPDWCGLTASNVGEAAEMMSAALSMMRAGLADSDQTLEDAGGVWHLLPDAIATLRAELVRHGADIGVGTIWSTKARWRQLSRW